MVQHVYFDELVVVVVVTETVTLDVAGGIMVVEILVVCQIGLNQHGGKWWSWNN
jgi:hypothetical protein